MPNNVLVPIDGSPPSWAALECAAEQFPDSRLTVLHVVDPVAGSYGGTEGAYYDVNAFDRARERGETLCEQALERLEDEGYESVTDVETAVETGRPARTIVSYADEHDVDHVVIGSHGRSGVSRVLLGSVAEMVSRRVGVPVTIVR